jgi:hypothetical protein
VVRIFRGCSGSDPSYSSRPSRDQSISTLLPRRSAAKTGQRPAPNCLRAKCNGQFNSVTRIMTIRRYADMEQLNCPKQSRLMGGQFPTKTSFQISQIQGICASIPSRSSHLSFFRGQNASGRTDRRPWVKLALSCGGAVSFKNNGLRKTHTIRLSQTFPLDGGTVPLANLLTKNNFMRRRRRQETLSLKALTASPSHWDSAGCEHKKNSSK